MRTTENTGVPSRLAVSARAASAQRSAIREIFDRANTMEDVIRLEIGEPSFLTPAHIRAGAREAADAGFTRYTPNGGFASLRELIAEKIERVDRYSVSADDVVVTPGAMNALFSLYLALLEPGEEVLLPTPGYPNMDEMVRLLGGVAVFYALRPENGYLPDPAEIDALVTPRTKAIFVNSPSNPTGAVFPRELMAELVDVAAHHGFWVISDEVYDEMILDDGLEHFSPARLDAERVVTVYSFSKIYAMTGWRIGYLAAPRVLADAVRKLQEPQVSCPSAISQKAAEAALLGPHDEIDAMIAAYRARRDGAWSAIGRHGLSAFRTQGTFYMLLDIGEQAQDSMAFALRLLEEHRVAVAPGVVHGPGGAGKVRISFGVEPEIIEEGIARIAAAVERGSAGGDASVSR
jgi:aspartate/methionine/tyrosine aminotransferase